MDDEQLMDVGSSMDDEQRTRIVQALHDDPAMLVLAVTGGGVAAISDLLVIPGASRTVLEVVVPYAASALSDLVGRMEGHVSEQTALAMARAARQRALLLAPGDGVGPLWGVGATAALATDRARRGDDRAWIALDDGERAQVERVEPDPGDRVTQDRQVADAILAMLARQGQTAAG